jgi:peptidoglycan/xylan/chitin deacetylase (PgdA/CDA1 family)
MTPNPPLRWRPTLLTGVTVVLHAAMLALVIVQPSSWRWALAIIVANHALVTAVGLWPRSTWLGPNWIRLPAAAAARNEIALTIDDGPDPDVTPMVLDLLDRHQVKATFFCIGEHAARHPELCKDIIARGHTIENHSQHHRHYFSVMGPRGLTREVQAAQQTLGAITGRTPQFFRAPAGLRNPLLDFVLARHGLRLAAWSRRGFDTRTADAGMVAQRLIHGLKAGDILLLHDGNCARAATGAPVIIAVLPDLIDAARRAGLRFVTLSSTLLRAAES